MATKALPSTSELMRKPPPEPTFRYAPLSTKTSLHSLAFHYSPLSTSSEQDSSFTATLRTFSTATATTETTPFATSSHLQTTVHSLSPPDSEVGLWFKIIVLVWVFGLLAISMILYIEEVWPRKAATMSGEEIPETQGITDEPVQSPTTALDDRQKDLQELRKRRVKNGETVVVGHLGSESRPPNRYAEPTADIEAYTPWKRTSLERAEVGLGIRNIGLSRPSSPVLAPVPPPVTQLVKKDDKEVPTRCFSRIIERVVDFVARKWRTAVGEDAEEGLLLPVSNEERGDGELGKRWMAPETRA